MKVAEQIKDMMCSLGKILVDAESFDGGNKSAGTRVRKCMQDIKVHAQQVRETVSEIKNG